MKKTGRFGRVVSVMVLLLLLILTFSVSGATLKVCKIGCEYSSIGGALDDSVPGDTIRVQNGNYSENLRIDTDVTITGANTRWVRLTPSDSNSPAIIVGPSSARVSLTDLTIVGGERRTGNGVNVTGDSRLLVEDSRITGFKKGLTARNSSYLKVRNSDVGNSEVGVSGFDNSEVITSGTRITSAAKGLVANDSSVMTLVEAEITNCDINSLLIRKTAKVNVLSSSFTNNGAPGIVLKDFSRLKMEDSQVSSNEEGGVLLADSAIAKLIDNRITYNGKKNVAIISKKCGFSGPSNLFFGEVDGAGNDIKPQNSDTVCPEKFSRITSSTGGSYSYPFKPSTYAFIGLVGIASLYFLLSG